jgi:hypothetical protein
MSCNERPTKSHGQRTALSAMPVCAYRVDKNTPPLQTVQGQKQQWLLTPHTPSWPGATATNTLQVTLQVHYQPHIMTARTDSQLAA